MVREGTAIPKSHPQISQISADYLNILSIQSSQSISESAMGEHKVRPYGFLNLNGRHVDLPAIASPHGISPEVPSSNSRIVRPQMR